MSKPAFVCVHGSWHNPAFFDKVKSILLRHEYSCVCPSLPSVGGNPPTYDFAPDVNVIRSSVEAIVKERDVIVVMHSYGGIPGGTALNGLDKKSCQEKGLKGGVVRLVYVNSFIVPEGFQHSPRDTREHMVPTMKTNIEAGIVTIDPEDAKGMFYQDLSDDEAAEWAAALKPQSLGVYWSKTDYAAWKHIPTTYVVCEGDMPSTVLAIGHLLDGVRATPDHKLDIVVKGSAGHSPFLSQPEWMSKVLREAAGEKLD